MELDGFKDALQKQEEQEAALHDQVTRLQVELHLQDERTTMLETEAKTSALREANLGDELVQKIAEAQDLSNRVAELQSKL